ncbi:hypothetical protein MKEN_00257900 [Mycena kentingensis (nom. inval.)]|nr:hypothetical protein MKEN_00257900 [Mycena kentingensis (nom. inval.)]
MASEVYGSLVAAVCLNLVLYTLEFAMACQLFSKKREEVSAWTKFRVWFTLLIDTAATLASCAFLYMWQGSHWGENDAVQEQFWKLLIGTLIICTVASALAQSFLLERFWKNIRHHLLGTAFAVSVLVLAVIASVTSVVVCAYLKWPKVKVVSDDETEAKPQVEVPVALVWLVVVSSLVSAIGITTVSACQRFAMRTTSAKPRFLNRVFRAFVDTGMPSTIVFILALVAWAVNQTGAFVIALYFVQARIYSCTMLYALRQPKLVRTDSWKEELISSSVSQKGPPVPPISPEIFLRVEKSGRLTGIPEENGIGQRWYNIDLGDASSLDSAKDVEKEGGVVTVGSPRAMVLHRNSTPFYHASHAQ